MADRGRVKVEHGLKRVRGFVQGEVVVDSIVPLLVWEIPYFPAYYFPIADVRMDLLVPSERTEHSPSRGDSRYFSLKGAAREVTDIAWQFPNSPIDELREAIRFDWDLVDAWFEEDVEVYVHPRSPYTRVDVLPSSRHIEVEVDGMKVADTVRAVLLFETGLPVRYYLPKTDVRMDLLHASVTTSRCPYKGEAEYYSLTVGDQTHDDLVWWYRHPAHESAGIEGLVSFYNEKVELVVDGVHQDRPHTKFS